MNLPTKITVSRIIAIVGMLIALFVMSVIPNWQTIMLGNSSINLVFFILFVFFLLASFTDYLDGHLARKNNQVTDLGKFLDPVADKLLINSMVIFLIAPSIFAPYVPNVANVATFNMWCAILLIARDIVVDALRFIAASKGVVIAANKNARDNESLIPEFTADNSGVKAFDVDRTFTYKDDMLSVYVCNKITNDFIKIDYYSRSLPTDDSLKLIKNIGTFDIRNEENGFNWIDVDHLAFTFNLELPSVKGKSTVIFKTSLNGDGGNMGSNVVDSVTHYSCLTNSTYKYYAVALSNDFVQIERWTIINPLKKT